jgi:hypothetical protein
MAARYLNGIKNVKPVEDIEKKKIHNRDLFMILFFLYKV